jgi:polar amino acid transport system permease protein
MATESPIIVASRARMSPRTRARVSRFIQYGILIALVVVAALTIDWGRIGTQVFDPKVAWAMLPRLPHTLGNTLLYTFSAFVIGLSGGTLLALMKLSSVGPYRWIATAYAEFFRGIPALLVVLTIGFAVPLAFNVKIPGITLKVALALGCVSAAYISETVRAGLQAVPKGQVEAARSLGMSHGKAMLTVVIPQAFRIVLPPLTNEFIMLTKDTSLVYLLGLTASEYELTKLGGDALNSAQGGLTGLFVAGATYLVITIPLGLVARHMEKGVRGEEG